MTDEQDMTQIQAFELGLRLAIDATNEMKAAAALKMAEEIANNSLTPEEVSSVQAKIEKENAHLQ